MSKPSPFFLQAAGNNGRREARCFFRVQQLLFTVIASVIIMDNRHSTDFDPADTKSKK